MLEALRFSIREIVLYERPVVLRLPFRFGVVTLRECPQAFTQVRIEFADGRNAWGAAAEMMAPKWFDKNLALSNDDNFAQLRTVLCMAREAYLADRSAATAFGHFARHHDAHQALCARQGFNPLLASYGPALLDRAVLDALCRAQGISFYVAMQANLAGMGAAHAAFADLDFDRFLPTLKPARQIGARHTVGMVDAIASSELDPAKRVNDGLPESLEEVVAQYGHRYFKLKVGGDLPADLARLRAIARVLDQSAAPYFASLDGNEQYAHVDQIVELVARMEESSALGRLTASILFIEQPIARSAALEADLRACPLKMPVIIDESDGTLDAFEAARACGYAGISSKTCKGVYKALLNAARCTTWSAEAGAPRYFMSAEDLTTQAGLSVQQDLALVNLLGITHVERNGHHYVNGMAALPAAEQATFLAAHPDVYEHSHAATRLAIRDGMIQLGSLDCAGFASAALPEFSAMTILSS